MGRAQEQLGAQQQLTGALQGARGQDIQRNLANMEAQLRSRGMNDEQIRSMLGLELQQAGMQQQGGLAAQQAYNQLLGIGAGAPTPGELGAGLLTGGAGAAAQMMAGGG
jgi:hypothetical protein